jgi:hypothetical protein
LIIEIKTENKKIGKVVKELGQRLMGRGGCIYGEGTRITSGHNLKEVLIIYDMID